MLTWRSAPPAGAVDEARVAVIGGSHGGFLTGNLVGQHPERFCCGVLRNPVMDLSLMVGVSDIPDWCFVEATGSKVACSRPLKLHPASDKLKSTHLSAQVYCHKIHPGSLQVPMRNLELLHPYTWCKVTW